MAIGIDKKSLYINPAKHEKNPINKIVYLKLNKPELDGNFLIILSRNKHITVPDNASIPPCPTSPNIIPKRKGKVIQ